MRHTTRCAFLAVGLLLLPMSARAQITREDLRIPIDRAGRSLEALLVKPAATGRHPLVLISHGSPRDPNDRRGASPYQFHGQAMEFARRGWAAVVVIRRGFGESAGPFAEGYGTCDDPNYQRAATVASADLRAAIMELARRPDIDAARVLAVGRSMGGLAAIALAADPPPGLVAAINFSGGSGSQRPDFVCREERLIETFRTFGRTSRAPMLWAYARNDRYFAPPLVEKLREAFTAGGARVDFVMAPPFREDGHELFTTFGTPLWAPMVDAFLKKQNLVLRSEPLALPASRLMTPPGLSDNGRRAFTDYIAGQPHKAFARSAGPGTGWSASRRSIEEAKADALETCRKYGPQCQIIAVDDEPAR